MNRTPPAEVRRQLRKEVAFGCPIPGCGSPYLKWHHYDPPWSVRQHHDPGGMIALCTEHHDKADAGAYTKEQLQFFKQTALERVKDVGGQFEWMRREIVGVMGGGFYFRTPILLQINARPIVWFDRDKEGYLLLNVNMPTVSGEPRVCIEDNFWLLIGEPVDLESPPSGKILRVSYANGDTLDVEFSILESADDAQSRYPNSNPRQWNVVFPITAVQVYLTIAGTTIKFGRGETRTMGLSFPSYVIRESRVALHIKCPDRRLG